MSGNLDSTSNNHYDLLAVAADASTEFGSAFEKWLLALIQSNYGMTDEAITKLVLKRCETLLSGNITFHEQIAKVLADDEPVIARQHRLLATIYRSLSKDHMHSEAT